MESKALTTGGAKLSIFNPIIGEGYKKRDVYYRTACACLSMIMEGIEGPRFKDFTAIAPTYDVWFSILSSIIYQRNKNILRGMRQGFRDAFKYLLDSWNEPRVVSDAVHNQRELYLNEAICLLPFSDIKPGEYYFIPQFDSRQNRWVLVKYKVTAIELTKTSGLDALVISDEARVFAYGLVPEIYTHFKPQAHLIFMALNPSGQGFASQMMSILRPFDTLGASLVRNGKEKINKFIHEQFCLTGQKVCVQGLSMGGAQAVLVGLDPYNKRRTDVRAYNPPGLEMTFSNYYKDLFNQLEEEYKESIHVYVQQGNLIAEKVGSWPQGLKMTTIVPHESDEPIASFMAHALSYIGFEKTQFETETVEQESDDTNKWLFNLLVPGMLRTLIYFLVALPCHYLVIPVIRAALNHKTELVLVGAVSFIFMMLPGLLTSPMGIAVLAIVSAYLAYQLPIMILISLNEVKKPACHLREDDSNDDALFPSNGNDDAAALCSFTGNEVSI